MVAAGRGGYKIRDVALANGLGLVRGATPGMFEEFLESTPDNCSVPVEKSARSACPAPYALIDPRAERSPRPRPAD